MIHEQEYEFARFELEAKRKYGLNKEELENTNLFTLKVWKIDELKQTIEQYKKSQRQRLMNGRTNNKSKISTRH
jgi:hypothetical protein